MASYDEPATPRIVYVSGPVSERGPWVAAVIEFIRREAGQLGLTLYLPDAEDSLGIAEPRAFYEEIARRIGISHAVISVLCEGDSASVVESVLAGTCGKPQLILALHQRHVPRILRGMPTVTLIASSAAPIAEMRAFLRRARDDDWDSAPVEHREPAMA